MAIELKMPALSPTMEEGTLAKWMVKEGDVVTSGTLLAEIETDKATMEFEAIDEGTVARIVVPDGTDAVKVGDVIAILAEEGEDVAEAAASGGAVAKAEPADTPKTEGGHSASSAQTDDGSGASPSSTPSSAQAEPVEAPSASQAPTRSNDGDRIKASPLARRIAADTGVNLSTLTGSGPGGRIVKADVESATPQTSAQAEPVEARAQSKSAPVDPGEIPHEVQKLSNMRKTIARRLTEAKQTVPHIYLTVDIRIDALLKLRGELNAGLESRGIKLSVNDLLIKALAQALMIVPKCNVAFAGDSLIAYSRADISVAVSIEGGLITPIVVGANEKSVSAIATEVKDLAGRAKEGKLQPHEYQGGTASISNMGMFGIKQFDAVINPPQGMIMAIGAGEKRPYIVDDALGVATVMSATGSFDHRAIDGADGAQLMKAFKDLVENPLGMLA
ncbi:pyruvate dehydrogenase complex dihydrolipoamide acetyltransferase [Sphingorhabdus soli]|uniref:Acetyltransferase component of pyruvate dehydrogenase complex n=1 Tax=Flavisphingopyxis soli TaxID=2601267 RepID=A0A5C6U8E9_9SPHN|nr:pyruvate dehydrogenase complex dihydrolipoamide acetyltransferase [Sphingorhabdus soli]TXC69139.1 pyruvate dehydrogenase complex dihydrolipoamide acetyltransferase [Sphingorhabdus soli]